MKVPLDSKLLLIHYLVAMGSFMQVFDLPLNVLQVFFQLIKSSKERLAAFMNHINVVVKVA